MLRPDIGWFARQQIHNAPQVVDQTDFNEGDVVRVRIVDADEHDLWGEVI